MVSLLRSSLKHHYKCGPQPPPTSTLCFTRSIASTNAVNHVADTLAAPCFRHPYDSVVLAASRRHTSTILYDNVNTKELAPLDDLYRVCYAYTVLLAILSLYQCRFHRAPPSTRLAFVYWSARWSVGRGGGGSPGLFPLLGRVRGGQGTRDNHDTIEKYCNTCLKERSSVVDETQNIPRPL